MKPATHHTVFGWVFTLLFFVANSGFTVLLYQCRMSGSIESMPCCSIPLRPASHASGAADLAAGTSLRSVNMPCTTVRIAGGLHLHPTTLDHERNGKLFPVTTASHITYCNADLSVGQPTSPQFLPSHQDSPLHSVETYVLNSTFLI